MNPTLEDLLGHLARIPEEFLAAPHAGNDSEDNAGLDTAALVADLLVMLGGERPAAAALMPFVMPYREAALARRLQLVQVACYLLSHPAFRQAKAAARALAWLATESAGLAEANPATYYVETPDGREELVRFALRAFALLPAGENKAQFDDRLQAVSSVERARVVAAARAARERAKKLQQEAEARERAVRAELARKAAEEAAAKPSRE